MAAPVGRVFNATPIISKQGNFFKKIIILFVKNIISIFNVVQELGEKCRLRDKQVGPFLHTLKVSNEITYPPPKTCLVPFVKLFSKSAAINIMHHIKLMIAYWVFALVFLKTRV